MESGLSFSMPKKKDDDMYTDRMYEIADEYSRWRNSRDLFIQVTKTLQKVADKVGKQLQDGFVYFDTGPDGTNSLGFNEYVKATLELSTFLEDKMKIAMSRMETLIAQERIGINSQTFMNMVLRGRKEKKAATTSPDRYITVGGMKVPIVKEKEARRLPVLPSPKSVELSLVSRPRKKEDQEVYE